MVNNFPLYSFSTFIYRRIVIYIRPHCSLAFGPQYVQVRACCRKLRQDFTCCSTVKGILMVLVCCTGRTQKETTAERVFNLLSNTNCGVYRCCSCWFLRLDKCNRLRSFLLGHVAIMHSQLACAAFHNFQNVYISNIGIKSFSDHLTNI